MIGERLQEIRRDHGDTQQSLAAKLRVSKPTVQAWELGKSSPSHDMLVTVCRMYEVSADYLLGLTDIDPAYVKRRQETLSPDNLAALKSYEEFLHWKQRHKNSQNKDQRITS